MQLPPMCDTGMESVPEVKTAGAMPLPLRGNDSGRNAPGDWSLPDSPGYWIRVRVIQIDRGHAATASGALLNRFRILSIDQIKSRSSSVWEC